MDGTVWEKARLFFSLEQKVRVLIIHLPLFCVVFSLCFEICFSFFKMFKVFLALCCLIMPLLVNVLMLVFQSSMYRGVYISLGFDQRRTVTMHCLCFVCLSDNFCSPIYWRFNRFR